MDQIDYDTCAQFLARLDADAPNGNDTPSESPTGNNPVSPFDTRNSASPPGLSSGSATSRSPESLRLDWDPNDPSAFFADLSDPACILPNGEWEPLVMAREQQRQSQAGAGASPMNDYIKIENDQSPTGYFHGPGNAQSTISPDHSLLDPTALTALEGGFAFGKENGPVFDFNGYGGQSNAARPNEFPQMGWRPQTQPQSFDNQNRDWQPQQQPQQQQQQQQQQTLQQCLPPPQRQMRQAQQQPQPISRDSPLRKSVSSASASSVGSSRAGSNSDDGAPPPRSKKRKTSTDEASEEGKQPASTGNGRKQPKKTAHNMIEKRYRTNLNDKIAALRDSVPSLRVMAGTARMGDDDEEEDLEGLAPAHKLNKATVLAKATEYIRHLEKRNKRLQDENDQLNDRLSTLEKLADMRNGMGLQAQPARHPGRGGVGGGAGGGLMSRLMVGSLAGLMVVNGLQQDENGSRQLFAPVISLDWMGVSAASSPDHAMVFWLIVKAVLLFGAVLYVFSPGFFDGKGTAENAKASNHASVSAAPSLASPLKDRSHAWLTAIQTVWVPRHSVYLELAALGLKAIKLSLRRLVGWEKYCALTGMTEEQEQARVKSWTIALDAQLAGGDLSVNYSRLLLTLLASFTLPATPSRLMLNAIHIRVFFSNLGSRFQPFATRSCTYYWIEARKAHEKAVAGNDPAFEPLIENLAQLVQLDPSEVFNSLVVQKAHDLCYNCEVVDSDSDEGLGSVVKDVTIRSPLDALAAWYSSLVLQGVLVSSLKSKTSGALSSSVQRDLDVALRVAPPSSAAQVRAFTAKAVLTPGGGEKYLLEALKIFEEDSHSQDAAAPHMSVTLLNSVVTTTPDICVALRCGMALALMRKGSHAEATNLFADLNWRPHGEKAGLGLLGFVAAWKTLTTFVSQDASWANDAGETVDRGAATLRRWIGDKKIPKFGLPRDDCMKIIDFCNSLQRRLAGLDNGEDEGYVGSDAEDYRHLLREKAAA